MGKQNKSATKVQTAPVVAPPSAKKGKREAVPQKQSAAKKHKKNDGIAQAIEKKKAEAKTQKKKIEETSDSSDSEYEEVLPAVTKTGSLGALAKKVKQPSSSEASEFSDDDSDSEENVPEVGKTGSIATSKGEDDSGDSEAVDGESEDEEESGEDDDKSDDSDEESDDEPKKRASDVEMADSATPKASKQQPQTPVTPQGESMELKTLFVGNMPFQVEEADVKEFFKSAGDIVDVRLRKDDDGKFKGFGHVEFATKEAAQKAFNELSGGSMMGRQLRIDFAREKGASTPSSGKESKSQTVFVKGFDTSLSEEETRTALQKFFGSCGDITRVSIPVDRESNSIKGIAYLDFKDGDGFNKALKLDGEEMNNNSLTVEEAKPKTDSRGSSGGGRGRGRSGGRGGGRSSGGRFGGRSGGRDGGRGGRRGGGRGGGRRGGGRW